MKKVRRAILISMAVVVCGFSQSVLAQTGAKTVAPAVQKKVTVTLVRWPYT